MAKKTKKKKAAPKKAAPKAKKRAVAPKAKTRAVAPNAKKKALAPKAKKKAVAAKPKKAPKAKAKKVAAAKPKKAPISRRDGAGHIDSKYAADLLAKSHAFKSKEDAAAFLRGRSKDDPLAEELGKEFVETVTSGEDEGTEVRDSDNVEEIGGPFVSTTAGQEFDYDADESNPKGARREPFPRT